MRDRFGPCIRGAWKGHNNFPASPWSSKFMRAILVANKLAALLVSDAAAAAAAAKWADWLVTYGRSQLWADWQASAFGALR